MIAGAAYLPNCGENAMTRNPVHPIMLPAHDIRFLPKRLTSFDDGIIRAIANMLEKAGHSIMNDSEQPRRVMKMTTVAVSVIMLLAMQLRLLER
jgi:hypothetical protein